MKVVWITGASSGIGFATAKVFAKLGYHVIGTSRSQEGLKVIQEIDGNIDGVILDASDKESVNSFILEAKSIADPDILINNAGICKDAPFIRLSEESWDEVIQVNLNTTFKISQYAAKVMCKKRWGRIINVSSVVAHTGNPGQVNYSASKSALMGFTRSMALEVAKRGVTSNIVAPGFIDTRMTQSLPEKHQEHLNNMIPMKRCGNVDEISSVIDFLASEKASYITRQVIHVNGGLFFG